MLRDYVQELQKRNPNTTVVIHVERPAEESLPTREFKRLYVCLGALKEGFKACQRQLLGINAYPIEGPLKGHLLVAVGIDSNNGIYPFAYAFAESENTIAWTWFLHCLFDDLDLDANSIFTFVTDMKKVLPLTLNALNLLFFKIDSKYICFFCAGYYISIKRSFSKCGAQILS